MYNAHIKRHSHEHRRAVPQYAARFSAGESIRAIASAVNYSPYMLARLLVEALTGVSKKKLTAAMKAPSLLADARLRAEVEECIEMDTHCSPYLDRVRHSVGAEYEFVMQRQLIARGIAFESEDDLRLRGMSKTPDARPVQRRARPSTPLRTPLREGSAA